MPILPGALPRRALRSARMAWGRSPVGRWLERRSALNAARSWSDADDIRRAFYSALVKQGDLVFDVGANVGNRTKVFLRLGARVIAVEPQPSCASILTRAFGEDSRVTVVDKALGAEPGQASIQVSDAHTISSMSPHWIEAVRSSGRFSNYQWSRAISVPVTTLDALIEQFGVPGFIKIDVEGFEYEVLRGLSRPVRVVSFEFTPECVDVAFSCLERLGQLGFVRFNYSSGESARFESSAWCDLATLHARLQALRDDVQTFGDVYAEANVLETGPGRP